MYCLFKEVQQSYISFQMLPYQTTDEFKYWSLAEFVYAYHVRTSLARTGISFQNTLHTFKLICIFDMLY